MSAVAVPKRTDAQIGSSLRKPSSPLGTPRSKRLASFDLANVAKPTNASKVVDLDAERRRRERAFDLQRSTDLKSAMERHPAGGSSVAAKLAKNALLERPDSRSRQIFAGNLHSSDLGIGSDNASALKRSTIGRTPDSDVAAVGAAQTVTIDLPTLMPRIAMWLVASILVLGMSLGLGMVLRPAPYSGPTWEHTVSVGESLWALAYNVESSRPLEEVVEDIRALNGLDDATLHAGQVLRLPAE